MARHFRMIWAPASRRFRRLERQLRITEGRRRSYAWGLPIAAAVLCFTILVVAGVLSRMAPAEFVPIALFEGVVIGGLFIACMMPVSPPLNDHDDWGHGDDPPPPPPPADPSVWINLLADSKVITGPGPVATDQSPVELAGTRH